MGRSRGRKLDQRAQPGTAAVLTAPARVEPADAGSQPWYVAEGKRGQQLLDQRQLGPAAEVFESILGRLGQDPSYGRAVVLGRLARCFQVGGRSDLAVTQLRSAIDTLGKIPPSEGVKALRGTLRSELGDALRALGRLGEARKTYEAALKIAEEVRDLRSQCVDLGHLGSVALEEGRLEEALTRYQSALRIFQELGEPAFEAVGWHQLGKAYHSAGQSDQAERHYKEAARISEAHGDLRGMEQSCKLLALLSSEAGNPEAAEDWSRKAIELARRMADGSGLAHHLAQLADWLQNYPTRLVDARQLAEEALAVTQSVDPAGALAWKSYGVLAAINEKQAEVLDDGPAKAALQAQARDYRQLERYAPLFLATLGQIGDGPSYGRAVLLGRLGRCFQVGGRPELAVGPLREAVDITGKLEAAEGAKGLQGALSADLGDAFRTLGRYGDARRAYESSLNSACELLDLRGQSVAARQLAALASTEGNSEEAEQWQRRSSEAEALLAKPIPPAAEAALEVTLYEDVAAEYAFDTDVLVDGTPERRVRRWTAEPAPISDSVRPMLAPGVRTWTDEGGSVRFSVPPGEPAVERDPDCTVIRRIRREVVISGKPAMIWRLLQQIDGTQAVPEIMERISPTERAAARHLLGVLAATGPIDISGRPVSRFVHTATKKGVLPAGGLGNDEVLWLATDGEYRSYPEAPRVSVAQEIPARLRSFHSLTRSRRSHRDYSGEGLRRDEFDALLHTACGLTGSMPWAEREVKLRAYPSSGALYAVEIYPIVLRVEGLAPAVYHYRAVESILELVRAVEPGRLVRAALPVEREMLAGSAALVCLVGSFPRHERKYGQGGYRMLVAEAGHISQNLVLTATGLGLSARPFGGVFDTLLNQDLGLEGTEEQFLLSVLVGHAGGVSGSGEGRGAGR